MALSHVAHVEKPSCSIFGVPRPAPSFQTLLLSVQSKDWARYTFKKPYIIDYFHTYQPTNLPTYQPTYLHTYILALALEQLRRGFWRFKTNDLGTLTWFVALMFGSGHCRRPTYIHTYIHTPRQTDRQTDRQIDRPIYAHAHSYISTYPITKPHK